MSGNGPLLGPVLGPVLGTPPAAAGVDGVRAGFVGPGGAVANTNGFPVAGGVRPHSLDGGPIRRAGVIGPAPELMRAADPIINGVAATARAGRTFSSPAGRRLGGFDGEPDQTLVIEALVQGHLPAMAAAWVGQYAKELADALTSVALIRVRAEGLSLEVFGREAITQLGESRPRTLADAVWQAMTVTSRWLIQVDEAREAEFIQAPGLSAITVLSGVDEPALIACYRAVKAISGAIRESRSAPALRVAFVGGSIERTLEATQTLDRTSRTFLAVEVPVAATINRITPGAALTLYRGPAPTAGARLADLVSGLACAGVLSTKSPQRSSERFASGEANPGEISRNGRKTLTRGKPAPARSTARANAADDSEAPETPEAPESAETRSINRDAFEDRGLSGQARGGTVSALSPASGHATTDAPASIHLGELIDGLVPVRMRCPYVPEAQFAMDASGRMHVLLSASDTSAAGGVSSAHVASGSSVWGSSDYQTGVGRATEKLLAASAWTLAHAELLQAAGVPVRFEPGSKPVLHVLTEDARAVRALLDTEFRLHLLVRVGSRSAGSAGEWVAKALN
ncbi:MAG: hypothetical protein SFZ23_12590 [Planctomycetota bacterium]|nr:hypothetical protein [Planctomycetota bacterium]